MSRQQLHYRKPKIGDLVHPIEHHIGRPFGPYPDVDRVGLVLKTQGLEVLVQFSGERNDLDGLPLTLWFRRTNVITIDGVREIP